MISPAELAGRIVDEWNEYSPTHPFIRLIEVDMNVKGRTAGYAVREHDKNAPLRISLNRYVIENNPEALESVLYHEVAHHIVWECFPEDTGPHGATWRTVMVLLGRRPECTHTYKTIPARKKREFLYTCQQQHKHKLTIRQHNRLQRGQAHFRCGKCSTPLTFIEEKI
jgi:SprT protein